jgi:chromosome segregation ATPase
MSESAEKSEAAEKQIAKDRNESDILKTAIDSLKTDLKRLSDDQAKLTPEAGPAPTNPLRR